MIKNKWKALIIEQMTALGVQKDAYNSAVETLAAILEQRDKTFREFQAAGGKSVIEYTNKGGSTNMTKNPLLILWDDLSYKKMTGDGPKKERGGGLAAALQSIETD